MLRGGLHIFLGLLIAPYLLALAYLFVPPPSTLMLARLLSLKAVEREWVPLSDISPHLVGAVVASEDSAFCDHFGFDMKQIEASLESRRKRLRGASTITQQTAKNLFLWNGHSWVRKALETPLALWLEMLWPKRRILEVYVNVAEWGDGVFGAEAAAQHYFHIPARQLSARQAALLAAALPNPTRRSAASPGMGHVMQALRIEARAHDSDLSCVQ